MKEEQFLNKLNQIISIDEISALMEEEIDVPIPEKIQKMIDRAKETLSEKSSESCDIFIPEQSIPLAACALEGSTEKEPGEDPLQELIEEDRGE